MYEDILIQQVNNARVPVYMTTKHEIVEYYRDTYGETGKGHGKPWKQAIVHELALITGMKPKSLEKRFEKRLDSPEKKNASQYGALGKRLPPKGYKPPRGGYEVTFSGGILISRTCVHRSFTRRITGTDAVYLTHNPEYATIFNAYFEEEEPGFASESCSEPTVTIRAL